MRELMVEMRKHIATGILRGEYTTPEAILKSIRADVHMMEADLLAMEIESARLSREVENSWAFLFRYKECFSIINPGEETDG